MSRVDAVILNLQRGVDVATLVGEFMDLTKTSDRSPLCVIGGNSSPDLKSRVMHELTLACPSVELEEGIVASAATPVQEAFAIKCVLDSRRIDSFLMLTLEEDVTLLLVALDMIFTSVYSMRTKIYGGRYVDASALLAGMEENLKANIKEEFSQSLKCLCTFPKETLEIIHSERICTKVFLHGFSTRKGGCSSYPSVASLNLAYACDKRDTLIVVEENHFRLLKAAGASSHSLQIAKAVHGNSVWVVGNPEPPGYDAIVCDRPGIVIAAPAADCVTILFADSKRSVCAATHSGWKGTLGNVTGQTMEAMAGMGCKPKDIVAVIGPSIGVCCFEVGADVEDLFHDNLLLRQCIEIVKGKDKRHINLQNAVRLQLEEAGILHGNIDDFPSTFCTFCNEDRFFSYRRDGRPSGTQVGFIAIC